MAEQPRYAELTPDMVSEDLARFQSRAEYPRDWMDGDLSDVNVFNDLFAGLISVWEDPDDKKVYVIDGHRRLRLAKRVQATFVRVQFLKAERDADAFVMGVELNLAQWAFEHSNGGINWCGRLLAVVRPWSAPCTHAGLMWMGRLQSDSTNTTRIWGDDILHSLRTIRRRRG